MRGFTDIHHHIVYGVDDGPRSFDESAWMLRAAGQNGITQLIATSHMTPGMQPFDRNAYLQKIEELNGYCEDNSVPLTVHSGCEVLYTDAVARYLQTGEILTLAQSRFVLVEFIPDDPYQQLYDAAYTMANNGVVPVFAHIERYECLTRDVSRIEELREMFGTRMQINCRSIISPKGFRTRRFLRTVLEGGLIDYVATDSHNRTTRVVCMRECFQTLSVEYGSDLAIKLTGGNQQEIFTSY